MKEAVKVDDKTVKLVLKHPFLGILGCLVSTNCAIVPEKAYKASPDGFSQKAHRRRPPFRQSPDRCCPRCEHW